MFQYDFKAIEKKSQDFWQREGLFSLPDDRSRLKGIAAEIDDIHIGSQHFLNELVIVISSGLVAFAHFLGDAGTIECALEHGGKAHAVNRTVIKNGNVFPGIGLGNGATRKGALRVVAATHPVHIPAAIVGELRAGGGGADHHRGGAECHDRARRGSRDHGGGGGASGGRIGARTGPQSHAAVFLQGDATRRGGGRGLDRCEQPP